MEIGAMIVLLCLLAYYFFGGVPCNTQNNRLVNSYFELNHALNQILLEFLKKYPENKEILEMVDRVGKEMNKISFKEQ